MNIDSKIAHAAATVISNALNDLKQSKKPLQYGEYMRFKAYIPKKSPDEILEDESNPYWFWYAEELRGYIQELSKTDYVQFVRKK